MGREWVKAYEELRSYIEANRVRVDYSFESRDRKFEELRERFREAFVREHVGNLLAEADRWTAEMKAMVQLVTGHYRLKGVFFSKELSSFLEDPLSHLKKKIFNYMFELLRGRVSLEEFERSAAAAISTSIRTNMRTTYQNWAFLSILYLIAERERPRIVYPEIPYLPLERSGRQRTKSIPPNLVLEVSGGKTISFFLEAPRPISWEDTEDLKRYWSLYVTLRPDLLVYGGERMNILDLNSDPPITRPDVIVEFKELEDWYARAREVRGPFAEPMTAEEWRFRWLEGLWSGLSEILGVERQKVEERAKLRRGIRAREDRIVVLYSRVYRPKCMLLISRAKVPSQIRSDLEGEGIRVVDGVGFNPENLEEAAETILGHARPSRGVKTIELSLEAYEMLRHAARRLNVTLEEALIVALKKLLDSV